MSDVKRTDYSVDDMRQLTFLSCFAGIGGIDQGFERAGMRCVGQIEIDKHATAVLAHHWPEVPRHDDIRTAINSGFADDVRAASSGTIDVVCGGAPCQDLSVAGKRQGFAGERSRLVLDMVAVAAHVEARWIVYENVPGLLTSHQGRDLGVLCTVLADSGYPHIEWRVVDSQHYGVPQRRRRVVLVAGARSPRGRAVLTEPEGVRWNPATGFEACEDPAGAVADRVGAGGRDGYVRGLTEADIAAPLASLTGGPRTSDIESATFVVDVADTPQSTYWDGGQMSDTLDVAGLTKGQMMPEKRRMPAVLVPSPTSSEPSTPAGTPAPTTGRTPTPASSSPSGSSDE